MGRERPSTGLLLAAVLALGACRPEPAPPPVRSDRLTSNDGTWALVVEPPIADCAIGEPCSFAVHVSRADGAPAPPRLRLEVDAAMPDHRHGLNVRPSVSGSAATGWEVRDLLLHMPGYWEVYFDLSSGPVTERAQVAHGR